jgi:general secretion pathway protein K
MSEKGLVLILVLVVITLLGVLVLEFSYLMRVEAVMAGNHADSIKAFYLARAGTNFGLFLMDREDDPRYKEKIRDLTGSGVTVPVGIGEVSFRVSDEGGKINVNHLKEDGKLDRSRVEVVLNLFDILNRQYEEPIFSYAIAAAMVDWVDPDDEVTVLDFILIGDREGAESDYYEDLEPSYQAKNAPFDTLRELLLVRGINKEVFYGHEAREEEEVRVGLSKYVTVYGEGKININTAPLVVLQSLDIEIDEVLAQNIIDYREEKRFEGIADIVNVEGMTEEIFRRIEGLITIDESQFFSVEARGRVGEATKLIKAIVHRKAEDFEIIYWRDF